MHDRPHGSESPASQTVASALGPNAVDWLLLLALSAMWGTAFGFTRVALEQLEPSTLVAMRVTLAALLLLSFSRVAAGTQGPRPGLGIVATLAITGNALPFWLIGWGQQRVDSGLAGILMGVMPLCTLVLAHFFADEPLTPRRALGFALGFAGIVVLTGPEALLELGGSASDVWRQLAILGGAASYAVNAIVARRAAGVAPRRLALGSLLVASALMLPTAAAVDQPWLGEFSGRSLAAAVWLGVVATALATLVYFRIIARAGATFLSQINFVIPLIALAAGTLALGEQPGTGAWLALALILSGMALAR